MVAIDSSQSDLPYHSLMPMQPRPWAETVNSPSATVGIVMTSTLGTGSKRPRPGVDDDEFTRARHRHRLVSTQRIARCEHITAHDPISARDEGVPPHFTGRALHVHRHRVADHRG